MKRIEKLTIKIIVLGIVLVFGISMTVLSSFDMSLVPVWLGYGGVMVAVICGFYICHFITAYRKGKKD